MSLPVLERLVSSYLKTEQPHYVFTWQGGEPTLMGIDFFKQAMAFQRKYAATGSIVVNSLQTNALLMNDEFAKFFARHHFLLGVSLDGPAYIHDVYRKQKNGAGSFSEVMKGIDCLARNGVEFNISTLVSHANVNKGKEVYLFLREKRFLYHQYVECVEFDEMGRPLPYAITGEEWGYFLCDIFDEWIKSDVYKVSIRLFDAVLACLVDNQYTLCSTGPRCGQYFVVEFNGDIYPCDFFVREDLKVGNIGKTGWAELLRSSVFTGFASQKGECNRQCHSCEYHFLCFGDCLKNRFRFQNDPRTLSWLCNGLKVFYSHTLPRFQVIADIIRNHRKILISYPLS